MRYSSLFRSRWLALFWSIGIIWTAVEVSDWQDSSDDATINTTSNDGAGDVQKVQDLVAKLKST